MMTMCLHLIPDLDEVKTRKFLLPKVETLVSKTCQGSSQFLDFFNSYRRINFQSPMSCGLACANNKIARGKARGEIARGNGTNHGEKSKGKGNLWYCGIFNCKIPSSQSN